VRNLLAETLAFQPDVVHSFKPKAYSGLAAWWLWQTRRSRLPLFTDTDDWEGAGGWNDRATYSRLQRRFFAWQEQWGMRHCHGLTVASRALESLAWAHGVAPQRVIYLPNGPGIGGDLTGAATRRAALGLTNRPVVLLYSRLFEFDVSRLTAILRRVRDAVPDLALLSVGAGLFAADDAALRAQFAAAGLGDAVVDVGWLEEAALPATLAAADVGLYLMDDTLLNRAKCPVKLADMLQCGLPVVGEAVGQVTEYVVHGVSGLTAPSGDVDGVAAHLTTLLRDGAQQRALGAAGRARLETHFAWPALAARLEQAYG